MFQNHMKGPYTLHPATAKKIIKKRCENGLNAAYW